MSAKDLLRSNKTDIELILSENRQLILRKSYENKVVTRRDYINLKNINKGNDEEHVTELVDNIMGKGEKTCKDFVDLLQNDADLKETFPDLEGILSNYTAGLPTPTQETASSARTDDVTQENRKRKQEMDTSDDGTSNNKKSKQDEPYPLNSNPTGLCFIINNVDFINDKKPRRGSDADAERLAEVFSWLGFRVLMSKNQTKDQMDQLLKCLSSASDLSKLVDFKVKEWSEGTFTDLQKDPAHGDAFICCILSHGNTGVVCGTDRERLKIKDIKKMFKATELSPLTNKPKVFLIQACQGGETHGRVVLPDVEPDDLQPPSIPAEADFLVGMSTVEDYKSLRNPVHGSWYIQTVCKQMEECCPSRVDMCTILEHVNNDVSLMEGRDKDMPGVIQKQMPEIRSTLRRKLVFSPHSN